jgi:hypothetical protein
MNFGVVNWLKKTKKKQKKKMKKQKKKRKKQKKKRKKEKMKLVQLLTDQIPEQEGRHGMPFRGLSSEKEQAEREREREREKRMSTRKWKARRVKT